MKVLFSYLILLVCSDVSIFMAITRKKNPKCGMIGTEKLFVLFCFGSMLEVNFQADFNESRDIVAFYTGGGSTGIYSFLFAPALDETD